MTRIKKREWKPRFIEGLKEHGTATKAATEAGISRGHAYSERKAQESFAAQWDAAIEEYVDSLEHELFRRAKDGSDTLLIFALKGKRPNVYGDKTRHGFDPEQPLSVVLKWE